MSLNAATFLKRLEAVVTGHGFKRVKEIPVHNVFLASSGAALTTTINTNPGFDVFESNLVGLTWAAGKTVTAGLVIQVPDDYDQSKDHLKLRIKALMSGSDDTPTIDAAVYKDSDPSEDLDPDATDALSTTAAWVEIDLSGNSLQGGDILTVHLTPGTHATDAVEVYGMKLEYRSALVFFDPDNR